jgi:serine phosphatase RsbU (regulator of sigma subunit)
MLAGSGKLLSMASRKTPATNNHLQEAMALLIHTQDAFVERIARNDQERLALQRRSDERELANKEWQRRSDKRFDRIEERLARVESDLLKLPKTIVQTILDQLPRIRKEIGFKTPR